MSLWINRIIEKIYQKPIPFQISINNNNSKKIKSFCDIVERMDVCRWGKTKFIEVNRYILGGLTSFSVRSEKVINYKSALVFPLHPIPLNIANVGSSRQKRKKSKSKDIIIENTNLRTDENLCKLSRGTTIVDIIQLLNSLIGIPSSCLH